MLTDDSCMIVKVYFSLLISFGFVAMFALHKKNVTLLRYCSAR